MKQKRNTYGIDREYLRANMNSTPEQRLNWLAAAVQFVHAPKTRLHAPLRGSTKKPHQ